MISIDGANLVKFNALCNSCGKSRCRSCNPLSPAPNRIAWKKFVVGQGAKPKCVEVDSDGNYYCTERIAK